MGESRLHRFFSSHSARRPLRPTCRRSGACTDSPSSTLRSVIFNPFLNKLYSAREGHGAWLNETTRLPLTHPHPAPLPSLGDAIIGVEWGSDRSRNVIEKKGRTFMRLAGDGKEVEGGVMAHSLRSIGSVSFSLLPPRRSCRLLARRQLSSAARSRARTRD